MVWWPEPAGLILVALMCLVVWHSCACWLVGTPVPAGLILVAQALLCLLVGLVAQALLCLLV